MATEADYILLREDTDNTEDTLSDVQAEAIFVRALADFGEAGEYAGARVLVLRKEWATASSHADYTQNEESERLSQLAAQKKALLDYWQGKLDEALAEVELPAGRRPAFFGLAKARNRRWYPVALLVVMWGIERWQ